jgi:hypothetical protein
MSQEEIILRVHQLWRPDPNYGQVLNLDGIHAEVYYGKERVGRTYEDIIRARIYGIDVPSLSKNGFGSILEGQEWCEKWYLYLSENARLKVDVERYKANYRYVCDELSKLRGELNEAKWDELRAKYGWNVLKLKEEVEE